MIGQQREAEQEPQQVGKRDPLVAEVRRQPRHPLARLEAGEEQLIERDHRGADQRDLERVMVQHRHTEEHQREEDEVDGDAGDHAGTVLVSSKV